MTDTQVPEPDEELEAPLDTSAAWHQQPDGRLRWWDGTTWTDNYHDPAAAKATKTRRRVPLLALVLTSVGTLILGVIIGSAGGSGAAKEVTSLKQELENTQDRLDRANGEAKSEREQREAMQDALAQREADVTAREQAVADLENTIAENTIPGSGTFLVGSQVAPGIYQTGPDVSGCYWARLSGIGGTLGDIIANANVDGQGLVEIGSGDVAFETSRCGSWTKIG